MQATWVWYQQPLACLFKLLTETFREQKHYIWLQLRITWSAETQILMAALNTKQLGINVKTRKPILDTQISPTL